MPAWEFLNKALFGKEDYALTLMAVMLLLASALAFAHSVYMGFFKPGVESRSDRLRAVSVVRLWRCCAIVTVQLVVTLVTLYLLVSSWAGIVCMVKVFFDMFFITMWTVLAVQLAVVACRLFFRMGLADTHEFFHAVRRFTAVTAFILFAMLLVECVRFHGFMVFGVLVMQFFTLAGVLAVLVGYLNITSLGETDDAYRALVKRLFNKEVSASSCVDSDDRLRDSFNWPAFKEIFYGFSTLLFIGSTLFFKKLHIAIAEGFALHPANDPQLAQTFVVLAILCVSASVIGTVLLFSEESGFSLIACCALAALFLVVQLVPVVGHAIFFKVFPIFIVKAFPAVSVAVSSKIFYAAFSAIIFAIAAALVKVWKSGEEY